jgi:hypothetical protein
MSATDAAINLMITLLRADSVLSLPNGTGPGQNPAGVKGEIHQGSADSTDENMFPRDVTYPAIAIVPQSSINRTTGTGAIVYTQGLVLVKIVTVGMNMTTERRIEERVRPVLRTLRRMTWSRGAGEPVYYVASVTEADELFQPATALGDKLYRYKNLSYRTYGNPR